MTNYIYIYIYIYIGDLYRRPIYDKLIHSLVNIELARTKFIYLHTNMYMKMFLT